MMSTMVAEKVEDTSGPEYIQRMLDLAMGDCNHVLRAVTCPACNGKLANVVPKCEHSTDDWCKLCTNHGVVYLEADDQLVTDLDKSVLYNLQRLLSEMGYIWGKTMDCEIGYANGPTIPIVTGLDASLEVALDDVEGFFDKDHANLEKLRMASDLATKVGRLLLKRIAWYEEAHREYVEARAAEAASAEVPALAVASSVG